MRYITPTPSVVVRRINEIEILQSIYLFLQSFQCTEYSYAEKEYLNEEKPRSQFRVKADEQSSLSLPKSQGLTQFRCRNVICGHCNSTKNYPGSSDCNNKRGLGTKKSIREERNRPSNLQTFLAGLIIERKYELSS